MNGIIITTGQRPSTGGVRKRIKRIGRLAWKGVAGVTYPDETCDVRSEQKKPDGKGWVKTEEAAKILKVSGASARRKLHAAHAQYARVKNAMYWQRSDVEALAKNVDFECISYVPKGWIAATKACKQFGISRTALQRYYLKEEIRSRRVRMRNSRNNNTITLLAVDDVEAIAKMREVRRKAEEECRAYMAEWEKKVRPPKKNDNILKRNKAN